jgi:hypothetical protein
VKKCGTRACASEGIEKHLQTVSQVIDPTPGRPCLAARLTWDDKTTDRRSIARKEIRWPPTRRSFRVNISGCTAGAGPAKVHSWRIWDKHVDWFNHISWNEGVNPQYRIEEMVQEIWDNPDDPDHASVLEDTARKKARGTDSSSVGFGAELTKWDWQLEPTYHLYI